MRVNNSSDDHNVGIGMPKKGKYRTAVESIGCSHCGAEPTKSCKSTSSVVHTVRRNKAIDEGHWDPDKAHVMVSKGEMYGEPLEALKPR